MTEHLIGLRQERGNIVAQMKAMLDRAESAGRDLSDTESQTFNDLKAKSDKLAERIDRNETVRDLDSHMNEMLGPKPRTGISPQNGGWKSNQRRPVLAKGEKLSPVYNGPPLGEVLRGLVLGTKDPDIRNALEIGTPGSGGYLVPETLSGEYFDMVRDNSRVFQAGATTVPMDYEQVHIAKGATDPVPSFRAEGAPVLASQGSFDRVSFRARTLAVKTTATIELLEDGVGMAEIIGRQLTTSMAQAIDRAALLGTGTANEPLGLLNQSGVQVVDMGTNGAPLAGYGEIVQAMLKLREFNHTPNAAIMAPREFHKFAGLVDTTGQPLRRPDAIDFPFYDTNKVPIDMDQGTAEDASLIAVGDFSQLLIGLRTEVRVEVSRVGFEDDLTVTFVAYARLDIQLARANAFCLIKGITP